MKNCFSLVARLFLSLRRLFVEVFQSAFLNSAISVLLNHMDLQGPVHGDLASSASKILQDHTTALPLHKLDGNIEALAWKYTGVKLSILKAKMTQYSLSNQVFLST
uniref:Uncharacterized protein n=1 Tax=Salix viminalis TaxID=40686 RepID=A0A6N2KVU7_SALVM